MALLVGKICIWQWHTAVEMATALSYKGMRWGRDGIYAPKGQPASAAGRGLSPLANRLWWYGEVSMVQRRA